MSSRWVAAIRYSGPLSSSGSQIQGSGTPVFCQDRQDRIPGRYAERDRYRLRKSSSCTGSNGNGLRAEPHGQCPGPDQKNNGDNPSNTLIGADNINAPNHGSVTVWVPTVSAIDPATRDPDDYRGFIVEGWDFPAGPAPQVYLRRQGSSCEFCGVQATDVRVTTPTTLQCLFDLSGEASGPASYDVLVTNSNLQDSYGILKNGLTILEHTPVPTQETLVTP